MTQQPFFRHDGARYAAARPRYPQALVQQLADLCSGRTLAVDVGCGSGQLSRVLAECFEQVVGLDTSEAQLARAERHGRVQYRRGAAEATGLDPACADLVVAAQAAHWFDHEAFHREVRRIAKPGAVVALVTYGVPRLEGEVSGPFQRGYWQRIHRFWPPQRRHVEDAYASLPFPFDPLSCPELELQVSMAWPTFRDYLRTWSAWEAARRAGEQAVFEDWVDELATAWGEPERSRRVRWPLVTRAGRV